MATAYETMKLSIREPYAEHPVNQKSIQLTAFCNSIPCTLHPWQSATLFTAQQSSTYLSSSCSAVSYFILSHRANTGVFSVSTHSVHLRKLRSCLKQLSDFSQMDRVLMKTICKPASLWQAADILCDSHPMVLCSHQPSLIPQLFFSLHILYS